MTVSISTISDERQFVQYMAMRNAPRDTLVRGVHPNSHKALTEYATLLEALTGGHEATDEEPWTTVDLSGMATYHANAVAAVAPFVAALQRCMETINGTLHIVNLLAVATGVDEPFAIEPEEITVQDYLATLATAIATLQATQSAMIQAAQALGMNEETQVEHPQVLPEPMSAKTAEQHMADLNAWLAERGLIPVAFAVGKRTGQLSPIADFMPDTHTASFVLLPRQQ